MKEPTIDPGFGTKYRKKTKRIINHDGTFNIKRTGLRYSTANLYNSMINMSWPRFLFMVFLVYIAVNSLFAFVYTFIGVQQINVPGGLPWGEQWLNAFYFSCQSFTSVGYGGFHPLSHSANLVASFEALVGLLSFALATGLLYGRFSKPSARLLFSKNVLVSPYKDGWGLNFRIANRRNNMLVNLQAEVLLMVTKEGERKYYSLDLEISRVMFLPLNWTIVHPINEDSPLWNKRPDELLDVDAEIIILIQGFDDTFSQTVHSRFSYLLSDFVWGARFKQPYYTTDDGEVIFEVDHIHDWDPISSNWSPKAEEEPKADTEAVKN